MKWTGPAARINTQARQTEFCCINYQRNLRPLQAHWNAWKLMSDPASVTGHRVNLGKMGHNFLSKPTHETHVNTIGRLPLPEHYLYKRLAQQNHARISEAYALTRPAAPLHIHRHIAVVMRTHFSRTLLALHTSNVMLTVHTEYRHVTVFPGTVNGPTHTLPFMETAKGRISTTTFHISLLCRGELSSSLHSESP
jgi:hypothetical protein